MSVLGIGPISAMAIQVFAPPMESFQRGRNGPRVLYVVSEVIKRLPKGWSADTT